MSPRVGSAGFVDSSPCVVGGFWVSQRIWYGGTVTSSARSTASGSWDTRDPYDTWWTEADTYDFTRTYVVELNGSGYAYPASHLWYPF